MKLKLLIELDYDEELMHNGDRDQVAMRWFFDEALFGDNLILHCNEIGDEVGKIKVLKNMGVNDEVLR